MLSSLLYKGIFESIEPVEKDFYYKNLQRHSLSPYIKIDYYNEERGYYVTKDGYIGIVCECVPYLAPSLDSFNQLVSLYSTDFPIGTEIQFTLWASDFLEPFVDVLRKLRNPGDYWADISSNFLLNNKNKGPNDAFKVPFRDFRLFISFKMPLPDSISIYNKEDVDEFYLENQDYFGNIYSTLESLQFFPKKLNAQDLLSYFYMILNPGHDKRLSPLYTSNLPFYKQVIMADTPIEVRNYNVYIDGYYGTAITIKEFPESFTFEDTFDFIGSIFRPFEQIESPFILSFGVRFDGHHKIYDELASKHEKILKQQFASSAFPKLKERRMEVEFINDMMVKYRLLRGNLVWWIYSKNRKHLQTQEKKLEAILNKYNFKPQKEKKQSALAQFLNTLPLCTDKDLDDKVFKRYRTMFDYNAAHLTPVAADWKGTGTPVMYFFSRRGQIFAYNLFDTDSDGYNFVIVARTGSGKSFLANHIVSAYYSLPDVSNIWIIDIGRSYESICKLLNGTFIDYTPDADIVINPFDIIKNIETSMEFLISIYGKMAKEKEVLSDNERTILGKAIRFAYKEKGNQTCVDDIYNELMSIANENSYEAATAKFLALGLEPWKTDGVYGKFVNGKTNIDITNKLTVLELKGLENREHLRQVILMLFLYIITDKVIVEDNRKEKKMAIIDEFWKYVNDPAVVYFVRLAYKTWRKHKASIGTITQSITDYLKNDDLRDILDQTAHKFFLRQTPEAISRFQKESEVVLQPFEYELLKTVRTVKGKYSEIFFITPFGNGLGRLVVDRYLYWIYTTEASEVAIREEKIRKNNGDIKKAIMECVNEYG